MLVFKILHIPYWLCKVLEAGKDTLQGNSPAMGDKQGTQHLSSYTDSSPCVLLCRERFWGLGSKPTLPSKPSEDRLNLKSQALIKHHQISNEKSCCSVIPGYVKQPKTIPDWKPALHDNYSSRNTVCLPTLFSFDSAFQSQRGTFPHWKFTAFFPSKCHCYFPPSLAILSFLQGSFSARYSIWHASGSTFCSPDFPHTLWGGRSLHI